MGCNHRDPADTSRAIARVLADCGDAAARKIGLKSWPSALLGCGYQGCVYDIGHGKVAKVTCSMNELRFHLFAKETKAQEDVFMLPVAYDAFRLGEDCGGPQVEIDYALSGERVWPYGIAIREDLIDVKPNLFNSVEDLRRVEMAVDVAAWAFMKNNRRSHETIQREFTDATKTVKAGGNPAVIDAERLYISYLRRIHVCSDFFHRIGLIAKDVKLENFGLRPGSERIGMVLRDLGFIHPPEQQLIDAALDPLLPKLPQLAGLGHHRLAIDDDWPDDMPSIPLRGVLQPLSRRHLWEL